MQDSREADFALIKLSSECSERLVAFKKTKHWLSGLHRVSAIEKYFLELVSGVSDVHL
jgi:hypothetical protein